MIRFRPPVPTLPPPVPSSSLPNFLESPKSSILSEQSNSGNLHGLSYPAYQTMSPWSPSLRSPSSQGSPVKLRQTSPLLGFRERPTPGCLWKTPATPPDEPAAPPESDDSADGAEAPEEEVEPRLPERAKVPQLPRPKQSGRPARPIEKSVQDETHPDDVSDAEAPPEEEVSKPILEAKKSSEIEASPSDPKKAPKKPLTKKPSKSLQNPSFAAKVEKLQSEKDLKPTPGALATRDGAKGSVVQCSPASFLSDSESEVGGESNGGLEADD